MNEKIRLVIESIVNPLALYEGRDVKRGNGAVINSLKKYIGKKAVVVVLRGEKND